MLVKPKIITTRKHKQMMLKRVKSHFFNKYKIYKYNYNLDSFKPT